MIEVYTDDYFMKEAYKEAQKAAELGEVPVGAVIVSKKKIIARAHNQVEQLEDITAHAEIIAITAAAQFLGSKYLDDCTLYVSLEPCCMCAGAIAHARLARVVYAADDDKGGFMRFGKKMLHPKTTLEFGIMHDECSLILKEFFQQKRALA